MVPLGPASGPVNLRITRICIPDGRDPFRQTVHQRRLRKLERMGLAEVVPWRLDDG